MSLADLAELVPNEPWRARAYCLSADPDIFAPETTQDAADAKKICGRCPVAAECLEAALALPQYEDAGIWGGTSPRDRARIRRERGTVRQRFAWAERGAA